MEADPAVVEVVAAVVDGGVVLCLHQFCSWEKKGQRPETRRMTAAALVERRHGQDQAPIPGFQVVVGHLASSSHSSLRADSRTVSFDKMSDTVKGAVVGAVAAATGLFLYNKFSKKTPAGEIELTYFPIAGAAEKV